MGLVFDDKLERRFTYRSLHEPQTGTGDEALIMNSRKDRLLTKVTITIFAGALALVSFMGVTEKNIAEKNTSEPMCNLYGEQEVQPAEGDNILTLVHLIHGSGAGEGDVCWDTAREAVEATVSTGIPRTDRTYTIPRIVTTEKLDETGFQPAQ